MCRVSKTLRRVDPGHGLGAPTRAAEVVKAELLSWGINNHEGSPTHPSGHVDGHGRAFDIPTMLFTPSGAKDDGPLATDRPHTGKVFGSYTQKWGKMATILGITQSAFQGSPISSCLPVVGSASACSWAEGRGNFVQLTRAANGDVVKGDVIQNARTANFFQTDVNLRHEIPIAEGKKIGFEANITNLFNRRAEVAINQVMLGTGVISPSRTKRFADDPGIDWAKLFGGYNYIDAINRKGAFADGGLGFTLASRYGLPQVFQGSRTVRLAVRFTF